MGFLPSTLSIHWLSSYCWMDIHACGSVITHAKLNCNDTGICYHSVGFVRSSSKVGSWLYKVLCCLYYSVWVGQLLWNSTETLPHTFFSSFSSFLWLPAVQPSSPSPLLFSNLHLVFLLPFILLLSLFSPLTSFPLPHLNQTCLPPAHYLPLFFLPSPLIAMIISSSDKHIGCAWRRLCYLTHRDSECVCTDLSLYACEVLFTMCVRCTVRACGWSPGSSACENELVFGGLEGNLQITYPCPV